MTHLRNHVVNKTQPHTAHRLWQSSVTCRDSGGVAYCKISSTEGREPPTPAPSATADCTATIAESRYRSDAVIRNSIRQISPCTVSQLHDPPRRSRAHHTSRARAGATHLQAAGNGKPAVVRYAHSIAAMRRSSSNKRIYDPPHGTDLYPRGRSRRLPKSTWPTLLP